MSSARPEPTGRSAARIDGERSRTAILDAAERLLAERGFSGTGIAAISRESGLPASSIYWFFASKRDLTEAVVERAAERWLDAFEGEVERGAMQQARLRDFFQHALRQSGSKLPDFLRLQILLALERGDSDPKLRARLKGVSDRMRELLAGVIENGLPGKDREAARRAADDVCFLARGVVEGTLIAQQLEPEGIDLDRLPEDLEVAILAIAKNRLRRQEAQ